MRKWLKLDQSIMLNDTRWIFPNLLALCQHLIRLYKTFQFIFNRGSFSKRIFAYFEGHLSHSRQQQKLFSLSQEIKEGKCETQRLFKTENLVCRNQNWFPLDMNVLCWQLTSTSPCQNLSQLFRQISE